MSSIQIGPLSEIHFSDLKEILEPVQGPLKRYEDADLLEDFKNRVIHKIDPNPSFSGLPEFIYTEVEKENLLLVKGYLDKIGMPLIEAEPLQDSEDYLCPRCKFYALTPGICPKHQIPLLDFSSWVADKEVRAKKTNQYIAKFVVVGLVCLVAWALYYFVITLEI